MNAACRFFVVSILTATLHCVAGAAELSVAEYRGELKAILAALDAGNLSDAQRVARKLDGARVKGDVPFKADASILDPIAKASFASDTVAQKARIKTLLAALDGGAADAHAAGKPDGDLLKKLRRDEEITLPPKDGEVANLDIDPGTMTVIERYMRRFFKWVEDEITDLLNWLGKLIPKSGVGGGIGGYVNYIVVIAVAAAALLIAWLYFKRRSFKPMPVAPTIAQAPAKDADPLSRGADEWEQYAAQLASTGRYREAIRAWYHAALVLLFRSGMLSYRKGRTNWEYCYSLPQDVPGRGIFQQLTGGFEVEWYGRSQSSPDSAGAYAAAAKQFLAKTRGGRSA